MNRSRPSPGLWHHLPAALFILLLAVGLGLAVNGPLVRKAFLTSGNAPAPAWTPTDTNAELLPLPVELAEIADLTAAGAVLVDARHADDFAAGHLPGAISLPLGDVADRLGKFKQRLPAETIFIVYCSGYTCHDSFELGQQLLAAGYRDVRVFEGGLPQWRDAGLPLAKEQP